MNNTKDARNLSKFNINNQKTLSIEPKKTVTTTIEFGNGVAVGDNNYLLGYTSKNDNEKTCIIFIGDDFLKALQNRNQ